MYRIQNLLIRFRPDGPIPNPIKYPLVPLKKIVIKMTNDWGQLLLLNVLNFSRVFRKPRIAKEAHLLPQWKDGCVCQSLWSKCNDF